MQKILDHELLFISDPGHGWLQVPFKMLESLGIADKISSCSYMRGDFAYLEEDCDASLFIKALGYHPIFAERFDDPCKIRDYPSYNYALAIAYRSNKRERQNLARRTRHEALTDLGLKRVKGGLGSVYYE